MTLLIWLLSTPALLVIMTTFYQVLLEPGNHAGCTGADDWWRSLRFSSNIWTRHIHFHIVGLDVGDVSEVSSMKPTLYSVQDMMNHFLLTLNLRDFQLCHWIPRSYHLSQTFNFNKSSSLLLFNFTW